ncbi:MAG: endonuclease III domain-containing protein [Thermoplasmata archaeon]
MVSTEEMFEVLLDYFGPQAWWPGDGKFEMMVGAILTQNVSWKNVEKAIQNLKEAQVLEPEVLSEMDDHRLEALVRPAGFYRQKSARLKELSRIILQYGGVKSFLNLPDLRDTLLDVKGIGPETADSIALYGAEIPTFVVDAYTKRTVGRVWGIEGDYDTIKKFFENDLPRDVELYNEFHALVVKLGKEHCKKTNPDCPGCPISHLCSY